MRNKFYLAESKRDTSSLIALKEIFDEVWRRHGKLHQDRANRSEHAVDDKSRWTTVHWGGRASSDKLKMEGPKLGKRGSAMGTSLREIGRDRGIVRLNLRNRLPIFHPRSRS